MKQTFLIISIAAFFLVAAFGSANAQQTTDYEVEYQTVPGYKDFRFAIGGGYAHRLGKTEKTGDVGLDNINKKLSHGLAIDAEGQYFFKETWGLGLNANMCISNSSAGNVRLPELDNAVNMKTTQNFIYVGPSFVTRQETDKFMLISNIGFGPLFFTEDNNISGVNVVAKETTFGLNVGIAGEYKMNQKTGIGLKLSYVMGTINAVTIEGQKINLDEDKQLSVSNLMATLFISFRSW